MTTVPIRVRAATKVNEYDRNGNVITSKIFNIQVLPYSTLAECNRVLQRSKPGWVIIELIGR